MSETIINDPIHGTIQISPLCVKIIDTPQFQRLRNIKQLGGCYYVYPEATHNRFEHSIGVCHLAGKLAQHLQKRMENDMKDSHLKEKLKDCVMSDKDLLCIEIAGLCHDLGHGPFSHLFDQFFYKELSIVTDGKVPSDWKHENASMAMFEHMIKANEKLEDAFKKVFDVNDTKLEEIINFIKDLINGEVRDKTAHMNKVRKRPAYMYQIVANKASGIDVDKMDYFARDCHGLGMKSNFDHLRFIQNCRVMIVGAGAESPSHICIRDKAVHNLYELFHTRNNLFRRAYFHKVSKAVEYMVNDALVAANEVIKIKTDEGTTVRMSQAWKYMSAYQKLTDGVLDYIMMSNEEGLEISQSLLSRIQKRDLYKCVYESPPRMVTQDSSRQEEDVKDKIKEAGRNLELLEKDFMVKKFTYSYGKKAENPVKSVFFYKKGTDECLKFENPGEISYFLPSEIFQEDIIRVYLKTSDKENALRQAIEEWLR